MNGSEREFSFPDEDFRLQTEVLFKDLMRRSHRQLEAFISPEEMRTNAECIAVLVHLLTEPFSDKNPLKLPLFHHTMELCFDLPDENGVIAFSAKSHAKESECESVLNLPDPEVEGEELQAAEKIIDVVLTSLAAQLNIVSRRIRGGTDGEFDHVFVNMLGGKKPIMKAFSNWYGRMENRQQLQEFAKLSHVIGKVNEPYLVSTESGVQFGMQLIRRLVADVLFGFDTCIRIGKTSTGKQTDLEAFFEISSPQQFGRSSVESIVEVPPAEPEVYTSGIPGPIDLNELPYSMVFFIQQIFYHLSIRDLWPEPKK